MEEYMTNEELMTELINIAKSYGSVNKMCTKSLELKRNNGDNNAIHILDAAISLQIYLKAVRENNSELQDVFLNNLKKCINKVN